MIIKSIKLENFRNYESLELSFEKGTNILYGDNAQGKTNVLEAVYLSATTKSHKGSKAFKESSTAAWSFKCGIFLAGGSFHYKERSFREKKIC